MHFKNMCILTEKGLKALSQNVHQLRSLIMLNL
jgi:hypothetical protein